MKTSILFTFILLISGYTQICYAENKSNNNGKIITKEIALDNFDKVCMNIPIDLTIVSGNDYRLTLTAEEEFLALIEIKSEKNKVVGRVRNEKITFNRMKDDKTSYELKGKTIPFEKIKATLTTPKPIKSIELAGLAWVVIESPVYANNFTADVAGVGKLNMKQIKINTLTINQSQVGYVEAEGEVANLNVNKTGMGDVVHDRLIAKKTVLKSNITIINQ